MDKDKGNKKKPLKLSSSGRLQIRKNLGPAGDKARTSGSKKTIQIVFKNKNNQQKSSSTTQSNFRGSSSLRTPRSGINSSPQPNFSSPNKTRNYDNKNKKTVDKKTQQKKSTLRPLDDDLSLSFSLALFILAKLGNLSNSCSSCSNIFLASDLLKSSSSGLRVDFFCWVLSAVF